MVTSAQPTSPSPPPIGALIDNGALELVEILGYGGYGIVYRAIDTYSSHPTSYAVKCLPHSNKRSSTRQRQLHIREITLHKLASAHPGVVTLHRVIEDSQYTWIVMDYCGDGDLFTQILHNRRYLGQNDLIREVFLQLLDAVDYCHSLNIYHRDLKPENILCFEDGLRLAITDFGLATTEKMSTEFRTGSVYHMSPECQGGDFAPTKSYSPLFNDIWSLGIILLNLITGRNPWKSASIDDCTFQAYLRDPVHFLPTVLPISQEVNALLVRVLHVDWRHRMTLHEMRQAVKDIENFYSPDVLFEDSMARCPWEAGVNVDDDEEAESDSTGPTAEPEHETQGQDFLVEDANRQSQWSENSDSEMVFTTQSATKHSWEESTYDDENSSALYRGRSGSPASPLFSRRPFDDVRSSSGPSTYSVVSSSPSIPSPPVTPGPEEALFPGAARRPAHLTLDIDGLHNEYYAGSINMLSATDESMMQTAIESARYTDFETYSPFFYPESNKPSAIEPSSEMLITPTDYGFDDDEMDAMSSYSYAPAEDEQSISMPEPMSARPESPVLGLGLGFTIPDPATHDQQRQSAEPSTDVAAPTPAYSFLSFPTPDTTQYNNPFTFPPIPNTNAFTPVSTTLGSPFEYTPPASSSFSSKPSSRRSRSRSRKSRLLNPMRLAFTRRSRSPTPPVPQTSTTAHEQSFQDGSSPNFPTHWSLTPSTSPEHAQLSCFASPASSPKVSGSAITSTALEKRVTQGIRRRTATKKRLRSPRDWFSPGKLLAAVIPSP